MTPSKQKLWEWCLNEASSNETIVSGFPIESAHDTDRFDPNKALELYTQKLLEFADFCTEDVAKFLTKNYSVIDKEGNVIFECDTKEQLFDFWIENEGLRLFDVVGEQFCSCSFIMIMRDSETDIAYCSECKKEVNEKN